MGNLPNSRTATLANGDPIPEGLLEEIQDAIIAGSRKVFSRSIWPVISFGGSLISDVTNPANVNFGTVRKWTGAGPVRFSIPYDQSDVIFGLLFWMYGDGVVDVDVSLFMYTDMHSTPTNLAPMMTISNVGGSWINYSLNSITPTSLPDGGSLHVQMATTSANLHIGHIVPLMYR